MTLVKTVKVSDKGQIAIPIDIRQAAGIEKGDDLVIVEENGRILLEKTTIVSARIADDFKDLLNHSEHSLKEVWDNPEDDIWDSYLRK